MVNSGENVMKTKRQHQQTSNSQYPVYDCDFDAYFNEPKTFFQHAYILRTQYTVSFNIEHTMETNNKNPENVNANFRYGQDITDCEQLNNRTTEKKNFDVDKQTDKR